jgi:hypothetical protein
LSTPLNREIEPPFKNPFLRVSNLVLSVLNVMKSYCCFLPEGGSLLRKRNKVG